MQEAERHKGAVLSDPGPDGKLTDRTPKQNKK